MRVAPRSGSNSAVECQLPKLDVAGSIPVSRSNVFNGLRSLEQCRPFLRGSVKNQLQAVYRVTADFQRSHRVHIKVYVEGIGSMCLIAADGIHIDPTSPRRSAARRLGFNGTADLPIGSNLLHSLLEARGLNVLFEAPFPIDVPILQEPPGCAGRRLGAKENLVARDVFGRILYGYAGEISNVNTKEP